MLPNSNRRRNEVVIEAEYEDLTERDKRQWIEQQKLDYAQEKLKLQQEYNLASERQRWEVELLKKKIEQLKEWEIELAPKFGAEEAKKMVAELKKEMLQKRI